MIALSVAAFSEVARPPRAADTLFGAWWLAAPWLLHGATPLGAAARAASGLLLVALAAARGPIRHPYDGWDRYLV